MQKNHIARRGAGVEIGSSRRRCGVWWCKMWQTKPPPGRPGGGFVSRKWLSPWESWREAPERARLLQEKHRHSESIALTNSQFIAVRRPFRHGLALSVTCGDTSPRGRGLRCCRYIPRLLDAPASLVGVQPVVDLPLGAVGGGVRVDDCVELVAERVALIGDGVIAGGHAIHGQ